MLSYLISNEEAQLPIATPSSVMLATAKRHVTDTVDFGASGIDTTGTKEGISTCTVPVVGSVMVKAVLHLSSNVRPAEKENSLIIEKPVLKNSNKTFTSLSCAE